MADWIEIEPQRALLQAWAHEYISAIAAQDGSIPVSPWSMLAAYEERLHETPEQERRTHVAQLRAWMSAWTAAGQGWHEVHGG